MTGGSIVRGKADLSEKNFQLSSLNSTKPHVCLKKIKMAYKLEERE
jgi:hypothetical protein